MNALSKPDIGVPAAAGAAGSQVKSVIALAAVSTLSFAGLVAASYFAFVKPKLTSHVVSLTAADTTNVGNAMSMDSLGLVYREEVPGVPRKAVADTTAQPRKPQLQMSDDFIRVVEMYEARIAKLEEKNYLQQLKIDSLQKEQLSRRAEIDSISEALLRKFSTQLVVPSEPVKTKAGAGRQPARTGMGARELAKIYDAMPAQQAAAVLSQLEIETVAQILVLLRERQAAKILSAMDSQRAAEISRTIGR
ncbi:MAG: hypothetical protein QHJ34_03820 [bacterium]|jgi:flagellar motility protein MotE (MotC chaperone)|nr:hypothetical protein [candidate division KSB1 bacterium]MDH7559343.1 hypothetical protein [bacterium]